MKKKYLYIVVAILLLSIIGGCSQDEYVKYEDTFFDTFDTITQVIIYSESEEEFESYMDKIHTRFLELHKLYDRYNDYEDINNIKTINDNAGKSPVKVEPEIIDLIEFSKEWYYRAGQETNIAMGPVVEIWKEYTEKAQDNPEEAELPDMEELEKAAEKADIGKVVLDKEEGTVFLEEAGMALDVGSVAKGYAVELVASEMEEEGLDSALISGGGNIRAIGGPKENSKEKWGIGIQNPDTSLIKTGNILETVFIKGTSIVSSGDYQRYFELDGKIYHHIIDPHTLMPGDYYKAITIHSPHSGVADFLSTSAFLLPFNESKELIDSIDGTEALWVMKDGSIEATDGMKKVMLSEGASGGS